MATWFANELHGELPCLEGCLVRKQQQQQQQPKHLTNGQWLWLFNQNCSGIHSLVDFKFKTSWVMRSGQACCDLLVRYNYEHFNCQVPFKMSILYNLVPDWYAEFQCKKNSRPGRVQQDGQGLPSTSCHLEGSDFDFLDSMIFPTFGKP